MGHRFHLLRLYLMSVDEGQDEDVEGSRNEEDPDQKEHLGLPPAPTADGVQDLPGVNVVKLFFLSYRRLWL
jgi:hypothetical protein